MRQLHERCKLRRVPEQPESSPPKDLRSVIIHKINVAGGFVIIIIIIIVTISHATPHSHTAAPQHSMQHLQLPCAALWFLLP